jgi:hypothetical protein
MQSAQVVTLKSGQQNASLVDSRSPQTAFFPLPPESAFLLPAPPAPQNLTGCRLQIERPDGARLTLMFPSLDLAYTRQLWADFPRA